MLMETDVACCVRISLGLEVRAGNRCMRSATGHDEQRTPAGGASVLLERRQHTLFFCWPTLVLRLGER